MKTILVLLLALAGTMASAQKSKKPIESGDPRLAGLDAEMEKFLTTSKASSFAVAIVEKNKVIYAKGFGLIDAANNVPATENSLYAIGSCTKAFTATLIGLLEKDGKVNLDKPVRNYLPELKFYNDDMNDHITLRDMMCHRTGLPRHDLSWYLFPTTRDSLIQRMQYLQPNAELRSVYQYNNFMFMAQGRVAEKINGKPWEQQVKEQLFAPLGMSNSSLTANGLKGNTNLAVPYTLEKDSSLKILKHYPIDGMGPAGSIYSSVADMAKWVQAWIYGGKFNGKEIIPAAFVKSATSGQMISNGNPPDIKRPDINFGTYGFAWGMTSYKGHYRVEHGGNIDGFTASTSFFPTDSIGIIVLTNQNGSWVPSLVRNTIADRMLKLARYDWIGEQIKDLVKNKKAADSAKKVSADNRIISKPTHAASAYTGLFSNPGYGTMELLLKGDSLWASTPKYNVWLEHWHYDVFVPYILEPGDKIDTSGRPNMRFQFNTNLSGEIESINLFGVEDPSIPLVFKRIPKVEGLSAGALKDYTGDYDLGGMVVKLYEKNGTLFALVPGQPDYELQYLGNDKFKLKILDGYYLQFSRDDNKWVKSGTFVQPNGNFTATRKK
ncbi:MAG TPA: serine hydrolase [Phnomibacter sp.]|nr:serine hydrolase [Phnomibacter sp.]